MNETLVLRAISLHAHLSCLFPEPPPEGNAWRAKASISSTLSETASLNIGAHRGLAKANQRWQGKEKPPPEQQRPRVREKGLGAPPVAPTQPRQRRMTPEQMPRVNHRNPKIQRFKIQRPNRTQPQHPSKNCNSCKHSCKERNKRGTEWQQHSQLISKLFKRQHKQQK